MGKSVGRLKLKSQSKSRFCRKQKSKKTYIMRNMKGGREKVRRNRRWRKRDDDVEGKVLEEGEKMATQNAAIGKLDLESSKMRQKKHLEAAEEEGGRAFTRFNCALHAIRQINNKWSQIYSWLHNQHLLNLPLKLNASPSFFDSTGSIYSSYVFVFTHALNVLKKTKIQYLQWDWKLW